MIKKKADVEVVDLEGFQGGKGIVNLKKFVVDEDIYSKGRFFAYSTLHVGCSLGYHKHTGEFEIYYFLKGKARGNDNGTMVELEPGDVFICREGCSHGLENVGDCDLEYISIILNA